LRNCDLLNGWKENILGSRQGSVNEYVT
jgi:hypothetical protein